MRKLPMVLLLCAGLAPVAAWPCDAASCTPKSDRIGAVDVLAAIATGFPGEAFAQQLKFREVPPESVKRIERRRARVPIDPDEAQEPGTPPEPGTPATPDKPDLPDGLGSNSGDVVRIGHDVHVEEGETVEGDLVVMGGDVTVDGHVEGDVVAMGGDVHLAATARVDGDVACIGGQLEQEDGAVVGGQRFTATGFRDLARQKARSRVEEETRESSNHIVGALIGLMIWAGVAWAFAALAPGRTRAALQTLKARPAASLGIGAMVFALIIPSLVALALIIAILCITIIGIPIALAALFGYFLFLILMYTWGYAVIMSWLGEWALMRRNDKQVMGAGGVAAVVAQPSLVRMAVTGALILGGARVVAEMLKAMGPLHGLGVFIMVISWVAFAIGSVFGAGAWLKNEFESGLIGRLWRGRRGGDTTTPPPVPAPVGPAPVTPGAPAAMANPGAVAGGSPYASPSAHQPAPQPPFTPTPPNPSPVPQPQPPFTPTPPDPAPTPQPQPPFTPTPNPAPYTPPDPGGTPPQA
jgi:cytoskeletal protein CcmA (bactofilin family)